MLIVFPSFPFKFPKLGDHVLSKQGIAGKSSRMAVPNLGLMRCRNDFYDD